MEVATLYKSLADEQRARVLNLLMEGPLCVCHLQEILEEEQVKISKQLGYLKKSELAVAHREGNWMIYSLRKPVSPLLSTNIQCLRELDPTEAFASDLAKRTELLDRVRQQACCVPASVLDC